ncbi:hypothetical protein BJX61DRAFT_370831 [Aspergillus egyptiacus]|nr:hypothetical protein BJX61DRAFT_370831 [Aspergillus egyptiacus]
MMASPIYIDSSSDDDSDEPLSPFQEYILFHEQEDEDPGQSTSERPSKKARVRGPDTALDEASVGPPAGLGHNSPQALQDMDSTPPAADDTDALLLQILEIFPEICHNYVKQLIYRHKASLLLQTDGVDIPVSREAICEEILSKKSYPKQKEQEDEKEDSGNIEDDWEKDTSYLGDVHRYSQTAAEMLSREFALVPMQHIRNVLSEKKRLYHAFLNLYSDDNLLDQPVRSFARLRKARQNAAPRRALPLSDIIVRELNAAKRQAAKLQEEKDNEEEFIRTGNLIECQCCYVDVPANRCIPCEGTGVHFFCFTCIRKSAETQIGLLKYRLVCFDSSDCQAAFARSRLEKALGPSIMDKLDSLQQKDEIRKAGLEGLEECPFCEFKAIVPPVEEDREFRCKNESCKIVSCRFCKEKSHIPMSCEEAQKEKGIPERHLVEEAMSKALIRKCPTCKLGIVKEEGCNKIRCPNCKGFMCYICQKDITKEGYHHFARGSCFQDDSIYRQREQREIEQAEQAAIQKILAENPDMTEEQLRVKFPQTGNTRRENTYPGQLHPHAYAREHLLRLNAVRPPGPMEGIGQRLGPNVHTGYGYHNDYVQYAYNIHHPQPQAPQAIPPVDYNNLIDLVSITNGAYGERTPAAGALRAGNVAVLPAPATIQHHQAQPRPQNFAGQRYALLNDHNPAVHAVDFAGRLQPSQPFQQGHRNTADRQQQDFGAIRLQDIARRFPP